jgi:hypothetical protein
MDLLGDSVPAALAIGLTACVGVLAATLALRQTGHPALVWTALAVAAVAAVVATVATQRSGSGPAGTAIAEPAPGPPEPSGAPLTPDPPPATAPPAGAPPDPAAMQPSPFARVTVDAETRHANRAVFRSATLAEFAGPAIVSAQSCQGEERAGGEREAVVCYLPGDYQVRYRRWGCECDRNRERRQFPPTPGLPTRWTTTDDRVIGVSRLGVHDGVEGDYVKIYWDLDCRPVGATLYGPIGDAPSVSEVRRFWQDAVLERTRTC